jgi:phosphate transport system permease protein
MSGTTQVAVATTTPRPTTLRGNETLAQRVDLPRRLTFIAAAVVVLLVFLLLGFITWNGIQVFVRSGVPLGNIFSTEWGPTQDPSKFGILPFVAGTAAVTAIAALISTPLSVGLAIFMAEIAPRWAKSVAQPAMEVFVGIPSVVWGWLGITILVPWMRTNLGWAGFHLGFSWLAGSIVLSLMILPTITSISYDVIASVPQEIRTGSLALGSTRWQTIRHVVLPAATTGIVTAIVLGMLRAAGEALAVQMVIGNRPAMPSGLTDPLTTLTSQITLDMGNTVAGEPWNEALWSMGLVLMLISVMFVLFVRRLSRRRAYA